MERIQLLPAVNEETGLSLSLSLSHSYKIAPTLFSFSVHCEEVYCGSRTGWMSTFAAIHFMLEMNEASLKMRPRERERNNEHKMRNEQMKGRKRVSQENECQKRKEG